MDAPKVENEVSVKPADLDEYISRVKAEIETYEKKYNDAPNSSKLKPVFLRHLRGYRRSWSTLWPRLRKTHLVLLPPANPYTVRTFPKPFVV